MQTVPVIARSSVRRIANLDPVHPVLRGDYAQGAVLQKQFAVVGGGELESLVVKKGDIWIKERPGQANGLDFDADPLSLGGIDFEVVGVFVEDQTVDR